MIILNLLILPRDAATAKAIALLIHRSQFYYCHCIEMLLLQYALKTYTRTNVWSDGYSCLARRPCWWYGTKEYFISSIVGTSQHE